MSILTTSATVLPWLADLTLLTTLWLGILWLAARCLPRLSAARRHLLLCAGLLCIPVLMLGALRVPTWNLPVVTRMEAEVFPTVSNGHPFTSTFSEPLNPASVTQPSLPRWQDGLLLLWLGGIGAGLMAMLVTAWQLGRLRRSATTVTDERLLDCWRQACAETGKAGNLATLIEHQECVVPMTWGVRHPVVLLPAHAVQWSEERLLLVLRHELAHVSRRDVLLALVTGLMALPLWFHPLVWLIWRNVHEAREAACDDAALTRSGDKAEVFATQLLEAVTASGPAPTWRLTPMALCMAAHSAAALRRRLAAILDGERPRGMWPRWQSGGIVMALILGAFAVSGLSACRKATSTTVEVQQVILSSKVLSVAVDSETGRTLASALGVVAPGLQLRGILTEAQALNLLRQLDEVKEEVRLLSTPTVTTRSGQRARVEIIREFIYPTEFDPPMYVKDKPITPSTPTAFETRQVGVIVDFLPQVQPDGIIDLEITPEITQFIGFVNYGTPIRGEITGPDGKVKEVMVTENKIQQPIFHTMKSQTSVTLKDGQFLVIGGLAEHADGNGISPERPDAKKEAALNEEKVERLVYFIIQAQIKK